MIAQDCITPMPNGDCWRACIASIVNLPIATVPNFMHIDGKTSKMADEGLARTREWLAQFGLGVFETYCSAKWSLEEVLETFSAPNPNIPVIVCGYPSVDPEDGHALIAMNGEVFHDPSGVGLAGPHPCRTPGCDCGQTWWWIYVVTATADWKERAGCKCAHCSEQSITNLDGDNLCQKHADEWVRGEGQALHEAEEREREHGPEDV